MIDLIRLNDTTDRGGEVVTASDRMQYGGRRVARRGDHVTSPQHRDVQPNVIIEGDERSPTTAYRLPGRAHHATCGCSFIPSLV
ncbi:PAAR domain-containing protein [Burkholderia sp. M6-3]